MRGSFTLPRLGAHRLVLAAAALTTLVAAALATALAVFASQALPHSVQQHLLSAPGTALTVTGPVSPSGTGSPDQRTAAVQDTLNEVLDGVRSTYYHSYWSNPLGVGLGSASSPTAGHTIAIYEAATITDIKSYSTLLSGAWPAAPAPGQPIQAAVPATAAALMHVSEGSVLHYRDRVLGGKVSFVITGVFAPHLLTGPGAAYWHLNTIATSGSTTVSGFTTYGPLVVDPAAFGPAKTQLTADTGVWVDLPDLAAIPSGKLSTIAGNIAALKSGISTQASVNGLQLSTSLDTVLTGTDTNLVVSRSLIGIAAVELILLAAAALIAVARLLAAQREGEHAMLVARGATKRQLTRMAIGEATPLCLVTTAGGVLGGVWLARVMSHHAGGFTALTGSWLVWGAAVLVAIGAAAILVAPVTRVPAPGAARIRRGRQAAISTASRAGADLGLLALAVLTGWQLRRYSAVSANASGTLGIDPVLTIAPALALAGGTVTVLRLLPLATRFADRVAARGRHLTGAMASWQISRQPLRQSAAVLLIVLAVATGTLALAQHTSWVRSASDQAAFTAGADVRADVIEQLTPGQAGQLAQLPGVQAAMPASVVLDSSNNDGTLLAIDARQAASTALLRADQSRLPAADLYRKIQRPGPQPGYALPGRPAVVTLSAALGPANQDLGPAPVLVDVMDATGATYQLNAGNLTADGQPHTLTARLAPDGARLNYPLRITSIVVQYLLPPTAPEQATTFTVLSVNGAAGRALSGYYQTVTSSELAGLVSEGSSAGVQVLAGGSTSPLIGKTTASATGAAVATFKPGYGAQLEQPGQPSLGLGLPIGGVLGLSATAPSTTLALPVIATSGFLSSNSLSVGSFVQVAVDGINMQVQIVAAITNFPTITAGNAIVIDLPSLENFLVAQQLSPLPVTSWWLATAGQQTPAGLAGLLPDGSAITNAAGLASGMLNDPLSSVPQQVLIAIALAALVLAVTGCGVAIVAGNRQRRGENALLSALGVASRSAARQLLTERLLLGIPSALAGLVLGLVIAYLVVPAVTLTTTATLPFPPVQIQFDWPQILPLAVAVAVLPVLAVAVVMSRKPDPAAELRAAEAA